MLYNNFLGKSLPKRYSLKKTESYEFFGPTESTSSPASSPASIIYYCRKGFSEIPGTVGSSRIQVNLKKG
jgi:hypothetical protein